MQQRILVLGNRGMLGHMVEHVLASDPTYVVRGIARDVLDAESAPPVFAAALDRIGAVDWIINCIGITARHVDDRDPTSVARAIRVNAAFPHALATIAADRGARVIHVSTDGVFSGRSGAPYAEDAIPDADDTYGRTKLLGESAALNVLNIRCSIIGPSPWKREGLWEWIAAQPDGATVDGYTNHIWHGVTTLQFAEFCRKIIVENQFDALRVGGHIYHFAPNMPLPKAELVRVIASAIGKRITVQSMAHAQSIQRVLTMRADVPAIVVGQSIIHALRACVMTAA